MNKKSSSLIGNLAVGADALELLESFGDEELARRNDISIYSHAYNSLYSLYSLYINMIY